MPPCSAVFQINDGLYKYTYRCCLDTHDDDTFHLSSVMGVMGVSTWNPNKYTRKDVIVHWKTEGETISFLEPIFPVDVLSGERAGSLTGKASAAHTGAYGTRHVVCTRVVTHIWNDNTPESPHPPTTEHMKDYFDVIWRS